MMTRWKRAASGPFLRAGLKLETPLCVSGFKHLPTPDFSLTMCSSNCLASAAWSGAGEHSVARVRKARAGHICQWEAGGRTDGRDAELGRSFQRSPFWPGNHRAPRALASPTQARLPKSRGNDGRTGCLSLIRPSCAGSSAMFQNSNKRWNRFARQVRGSWRVDETYRISRGVGHISAVPWTTPERPWISSFAPSEMSPPPRRFFVGRSRTRVDRRARSRSRAIKLRVGLLVKFFNSARRLRSTASNSCIASGKVNSPRANSEPLEKPRPRFGARPSAP